MDKSTDTMHQKNIDYSRSLTVSKRDDMIQKARFSLSVEEQRAVLYVISKIKPVDTEFTEYIFDIKDFFSVCGTSHQSYTELKKTLGDLRDKSWWITLPDGTETKVAWLNVVRLNKRSGKVTIKLHEDMIPYLIDLKSQSQLGKYFTDYELQFVLPMKSRYGARLYEILKSYQKNNRHWYFNVDDLKDKLDCATSGYKNFKDFRVRVLEPAISDINKYSDITVAMSAEKTGRKYTSITFYMDDKTPSERLETEQTIREELDGQMDFEEYQKEYSKSVEAQFRNERSNANRYKV